MWALIATAAITQPPGLFLSTGEVIGGVGILASVIGALFWQLLKSKSETTEAYKSVLPVAIALSESNKNMEELLESLERKVSNKENH